MTEEIIMFNKSDVESLEEAIKRLEQENRELKSDVLKWQKAFSRQYQINENKGYSKTEEKYRSALEEIRNYCDRIEQGSVIGTQDCVINSIKNITNEVLE